MKDEALSHKAHSYVIDRAVNDNTGLKLEKLRQKMFTEDPFLMQKPHYEVIEIIKKSDLYKCLLRMPKPAVHHSHFADACDIDYLIELTYYDFVYYSDSEDRFLVCKKPEALSTNGKSVFEAGEKYDKYINVNLLRQFALEGDGFDAWLKEKFVMKMPEPEQRNLWKQY